MRPLGAVLALTAVCAVLTPVGAKAAGLEYVGGGASGSAQFTLPDDANCHYKATIRITNLRAVLDAKSVAAAGLSSVMTETNVSCSKPALGPKRERYHLRSGEFDGRKLRLTFTSDEGNAARHDVDYEGGLAGDQISGVATFARFDCGPTCNWTVKVRQTLTRRS